MPAPLLGDAATMPAIAVPWPFESTSHAEPSTKEAPETTFAVRSGCDRSTPVSRTATTAEPERRAGRGGGGGRAPPGGGGGGGKTRGAGRRDGAIGLVPADLRERPLV